MTDKKRFSIGRLVLLVVVLAAVVGAGWAYWIFKHPLATYVKQSRSELSRLGLEKSEIRIAGQRLVYWQGGEGPLLVLLHGGGEQAGTWAQVIEPLLERYRLLVPDLPGHGESEPSEGPLPFDEVVSGLEAFLDVQGENNQMILVGNSMGAWLATLEAHRNPDRVVRAVAVNGGPLTWDPSNPSLTPVDREAARELMEFMRDPSSPKLPDFVLDDIVRENATGPLGRLLQVPASYEEYLLDDRLGEISTPVELVWGESDRWMSLEYAERMLAGLPRARLTKIEACGHIPQNECPQRFVETLLAVLESDPPPLTTPLG